MSETPDDVKPSSLERVSGIAFTVLFWFGLYLFFTSDLYEKTDWLTLIQRWFFEIYSCVCLLRALWNEGKS